MSEHYIITNPTGPTMAVSIDESLCIGCNSCANICRIQTILPNAEKGKPPVVAYPDECWYCGCCVEACPTGALEMRLPVNQRILFKDKESGEIFRIGAGDAPEKSYFKAPFGWIDRQGLGKAMKDLEHADLPVCAVLPEDAGMKIGRYFGEKEEADNTEKLVRFMKKAGFGEVIFEGSGQDGAADCRDGAADCRDGAADCPDGAGAGQIVYRLSVRDVSDLLHRLCVSSFTAVHGWKNT